MEKNKLRYLLVIGNILLVVCSSLLQLTMSIVYAASTPWSQTDWSGGSGQTSWSNATKYDSSSNVTTSTAGQITLTNSEKLSNTGFETDTTGWSQSAESSTGTFSDSTFAAATGAVAAWPLDDTTSTQSYSRVVNPAISTGRNIIIDSDMETSGTTNWGSLNSATITKQTTTQHGGGSGQVLRIARNGTGAPSTRQNTATSGKAYRITGWVRSDGSAIPLITTNSGGTTIWTGTTSTSWQSFDVTYVASTDFRFTTSTSVDAQYTEWDDISTVQISIPAYNATSATQLLSDGDMEASGTSSWTAQASATLSKQTSSPHGGSQVLRIARNGSAGPNAKQNVLTVGQHYRISGYLRSDGNATPRVWTNSGSTILYSGSATTIWQAFDVSFVAVSTDIMIGTNTNTGTQYVEFDDVTVSLDNYIRPGELIEDGTMEASGTSVWNGTATLSKQTSSPHGGSQVLRVTSAGTNVYATNNVGAIGRTYRVTGYARSDGTIAPVVTDPAGGTKFTGTSSTSWQFFDVIVVPNTNEVAKFRTTTTGYTEWDDISITEINPLVGLPTNGVTLGATSNGHFANAYTFDGSNDFVNIYSTDLNSALNPSEGTLLVWAKVSGSSTWSDGSSRYIVTLGDGSTNVIRLAKNNSSNSLYANYSAGGTNLSNAAITYSSTGWFQFAITWSKSNDQVKIYLNGAQVGSTLTGLGTWNNNLSSTANTIGAQTTSGTNPWSGSINDVRLYSSPLSATDIANLYNGYTVARDTTKAHAGSASLKVIADTYSNVDVVQSVNVGDTNTYNLVSYAYTTGSAVTSSDAELFYNGATISTTYTDVGSGWYKLSGTVTGANASRNYGVQVKAGKTIYLDDFSVNSYASSGTLTSSIFDTEQNNNWGTLTFSATTPTNSTLSVKVRTSSSASMSGATAFTSCAAIVSGTDLSTTNCVTDNERYVQYQLTLSSTDTATATPTVEDITIAFGAFDSEGPTLELNSPSENEYIRDERPMFKWKAAVDATSSVADYDLIIDNPSQGTGNPAGDFTITDIPVSRTTDYVTDKYVVHYDGFTDADSTNDYISVYTKSSSQWSQDSNSGENDGKVREGKVKWSVKATDSVGNQTIQSRNLLVDFTTPSIVFTQINNVPVSSTSFETTDRTPTFFGKITDPLSGTAAGQKQNENGPKIASGPKQIELTIEKKTGVLYSRVTRYTINVNKAWWECDNTEISDNTKQRCNKYLPFSYTQQESLENGTYKITATGQDNANNAASVYMMLRVGPVSQATIPQENSSEPTQEPIPYSPGESKNEEPEVTRPITPAEPSALENTGETIVKTTQSIGQRIGKFITGVTTGIGHGLQDLGTTTTTAAVFVDETLRNILVALTTAGSNSIASVSNTIASLITSTNQAISSGYLALSQTTPKVMQGILLAIGNTARNGTTLASMGITNTSKFVIETYKTRMYLQMLTASGINRTTGNIAHAIGNTANAITYAVGSGIIEIGYKMVPEPTEITSVSAVALSPTSVKVTWKTNRPANGKVNWGYEDGVYTFEKQTNDRSTDHEFILTDLTPNTKYHYEVMSQDRSYVYDANRTFQTPPEQ